MDDLPTEEIPSSPADQEGPLGLTRREFLLAAAITGSGALMLLSRCRPPFPTDEEIPLEIPPDFKRFMLVTSRPDIPGEKQITALGSQCPDLACALWWAGTQEFEFFDNVEQIIAWYTREGTRELLWLD